MINVFCLQIVCVNVISLGAEKAIFLYEFWLKAFNLQRRADEQSSYIGNPFKNANKAEFNARMNCNSTYTDVMLYPKE